MNLKYGYLAGFWLLVGIVVCALLWIHAHENQFRLQIAQQLSLSAPRHKIANKGRTTESTSFTPICSQYERKNFIRNAMCENTTTNNNNTRHFTVRRKDVIFFVDDEHKVAYCNIPKIGSSTWKMILMTSTQLGRRLPKPRGAHDTSELTKRNIRQTTDQSSIANYTKFMIVRHPMDRFLSAYYDKMVQQLHRDDPHYKYTKTVRNYVLSVTGGVRSRSSGKASSAPPRLPVVGLNDFAKFVVGSVGLSKYRNERHWRKFAQRCDPCSVK